MKTREAAAILDVEETQIKNLIREGRLVGCYHTRRGLWRHQSAALTPEAKAVPPGQWWVDGRSVRARRTAMNVPVSHRNGLAVGKAAWK